MKRSIIIISLCTLALSASAQFKVLSSGTSYIYSNANGNNGMYLTTTGSSSVTSLYGGKFNASSASTNIGVIGNGNSGTKSIGLLGSTYNGTVGAGVYGTIYADTGGALTTGVYAGFFNGNVKVAGSITATSTIQGALLGESASSSNSSEGGQSLRGISMANNLSGLNVTTYQKERPVMPVEEETILDLDGDSSKVMEAPEPDIMDEQFYTKSHYALDADKLEEVFPDLVYVNKDGSKVINYVEMIPLLVQSINELKKEIEDLKGQASGRKAAAVRGTTGVDGSSISQNKLYQNTPNPFKETTTIHFTLADDAKDAYICIFDMTGKPVKKLSISSGTDSISFGGYETGEGMFLYSLVVNGQEVDTKRMIISR